METKQEYITLILIYFYYNRRFITTSDGILFRSSKGVSRVFVSTFRITTSSNPRLRTFCLTDTETHCDVMLVQPCGFVCDKPGLLTGLVAFEYPWTVSFSSLPQTDWCGLLSGKAWVHCNQIEIGKSVTDIETDGHTDRWIDVHGCRFEQKDFLPAVVQ